MRADGEGIRAATEESRNWPSGHGAELPANRRTSLPKRILIILALLLPLVSAASAAEQPRYLGLTLVTTNDLHANLLPFDNPADLAGKVPQLKNVGGAARRAYIVNKIRSEADGWSVLLLDSGDTTYGTNPLAKAFHGEPDVAVMNVMGYEAMEPGNHEFQWHSPDTLRNLKDSRFPWVCANLVDEKTGKPFLPPYVIREYNGVRVAFVGLMTQLVNKDVYPARNELGLKSVEPIEVAKRIIPEARSRADIVIVLSHLGVSLDEKLARSVPGIDVILGGHSHTRLARPRLIPVREATPFALGSVPVVQAFRWGSEIGVTRVVFRRDPATGAYSLMSCDGRLVSIDPSVPDDPAIAKLIQSYRVRLKK